jgi:uncharacterized protein YndB with AHSA1/START domain
MSTISADRTIIQEIIIKAPAKRVYEALTDPAQRKAWWGVEGRFRVTQMESDLRIGGKWRMSGTGFGKPFTIGGEYRTIEPPRVLAFTWLADWQPNPRETLVRFDLTETDGHTAVRLTHSSLTPEALEAHKGWPQLLAQLKGHVED